MIVRFFIASDTTADCEVTLQIMQGFLSVNRNYDTDAIIFEAAETGMILVIPPKKRGIATRYTKKILYSLMLF